jgi:hypothetical protein
MNSPLEMPVLLGFAAFCRSHTQNRTLLFFGFCRTIADTILGAVVRIAITLAAFEAIAATMSLGGLGYEAETDAKGDRPIWLAPAVVGACAPSAARARATAMLS